MANETPDSIPHPYGEANETLDKLPHMCGMANETLNGFPHMCGSSNRLFNANCTRAERQIEFLTLFGWVWTFD
jgi:hypothetical protein